MEKTLLEEISETVKTEVYGYGKPDDSDYYEYLKQPADNYFERLQAADSNVPECLLCWSLYEAVNIHNCVDKEFEQQKVLEKIILENLKTENVCIEGIKKNYTLLKYLHNISENLLDKKIQSFISYCMFADKDYILNGNAYWREVNLAVLEKVYIDSLNAMDYEQWHFPSTTFITMEGGPVPFGPDYTQGPHYDWDENKEKLKAEIYWPQTDQYATLGCDVKPNQSAITLEEACDWVHLDFIIKIDIDKKTYPRLYKAHQPCSCRRAIDNLFQLIFGDLTKKIEERKLHNFVFNLFHELQWVWMGETPKPEFGYLEAKPALAYCMFKAFSYLKKAEVDILFEMNPDLDLKDEYLRFKEIQKPYLNKLPFSNLAQEYNAHKQEKARNDFIKSQTPEEDKIRKEKEKEVHKEQYAFLSMMFYFLLWDIGKNYTKGYVANQEVLTDFFMQFCNLMEKFYSPFADESWNKEPRPEVGIRPERMNATWIQEKTFCNRINDILKMYKIDTSINSISMIPENTENYEKKCEVLRTLLYNFSNISEYSRDHILNVMDFVGEQRRRKNLFCQPDKSIYYKTQEEAEKVKTQNENNQKELQNKDCGFEIEECLQMPVPDADEQFRELMYQKKLTCRLLNDTDKELTYDVGEKTCVKKNKDGSENKITKYFVTYKEDYRRTNKNNLYRKVLYFSERNSARHYLDGNSLTGILNGKYPQNLLYAFIDAKDFFYEQEKDKRIKNAPQELCIIEYQNDFIVRHLIEFAGKLNLVEKEYLKPEKIWKALFNKNNNLKTVIKKKLKNFNYETVLGKKYLAEIKWFFKKLYFSEPEFIEMYYSSITAYLTYLALRMDNYIK